MGAKSDVDLSQIKAFLAVAEERSFTKASKLINLSQPSVSIKVKALEKAFGTSLIIRDQSNIHLSEHGKIAAAKLKAIMIDLDELQTFFDAEKLEKNKTITIFHIPKNSRYAVHYLLSKAQKIHGQSIKIKTQACKSETQLFESVEQDANSIGITSTESLSKKLKTSVIYHEELMLICKEDNSGKQESIDIFQLFDQQIWLPENGSESLNIFETLISSLGLELNDFSKREHVSDSIMVDLVQSGNGFGICLNSNQINNKSIKKIRINEFALSYALFGHHHIKPNAIVAEIFNDIAEEENTQRKSGRPLINRTRVNSNQEHSSCDEVSVKVGIQSRTIQTVVAGRAVQKLGIYDSFLKNSKHRQYTAEFKDFRSAAPILDELTNGNLDIAIAGDYAITYMANSLSEGQEKIVLIGFASINPFGSGSRLMIHKSSGLKDLASLKDHSIHVPFLSTAHGSLLYNLSKKNMLDNTQLLNLELDAKQIKTVKNNQYKNLTCFTPFDYFLESEFGYQKIEDEVSMPFSFYGVIARLNFVTQHPEAIVSFLKANLCSNYWFHSTPSAINHLSRWTGINESIIHKVLGERQGNDCNYMHDTTIREDWIKEFTSTLYVNNGNLKETQNKSPLIIEDFLDQAKKELYLTLEN